MAKKSISCVDIAAIVAELQFLAKSKLSHLYYGNGELLLQLHVPSQGKRMLRIIPGKLLCLTTAKETSLTPTALGMQLRKYLDNAFVQGISQKDSERIVIIDLERKGKFKLIVELFSRGNIVLLDAEDTIIAALEQQEWKDRAVKVGQKFVFPPAAPNWKIIVEQELFGLLQKSAKKNVVTCLATDLGLGGVYAEDLCLRAKISKEMLPGKLSTVDAHRLFMALQEMITLLRSPQGYIYVNEIAPFALFGRSAEKVLATYNEALNTFNPYEKVSPYVKKMEALQHTIAGQEVMVKELEERASQQSMIGQKLYEEYVQVQQVLTRAKELKKSYGWADLIKELCKEGLITNGEAATKSGIINL